MPRLLWARCVSAESPPLHRIRSDGRRLASRVLVVIAPKIRATEAVEGPPSQIDRCFENMKRDSAAGGDDSHQPRLGVHEDFAYRRGWSSAG